MTRRRLLVYVFVGLVIGAGVGYAATADWANTPQGGAVPYGATDGPSVTLVGDTNTSGVWTESGNTHDSILNTTYGNITFSSDNPTSLNISTSEIDGAWTNVTGVSAGSTWIDIYPTDKPKISIRGDVDTFSEYETISPDDGQVDFVYNGTDGGLTSVKLYNLKANTVYGAFDPGSSTLLATSETDSSGTLTLDLTNSEHAVELKSAENANSPEISNLSPTGLLDYDPSTIEFDVSDADFAEDDNVTVETYLDGSLLDTTYVTSNSTLSVSIPASGKTGGVHDIRINATDEYSLNTELEDTYSTPDQLYIRNELNHSELIKDPVNTTVTFFGPEETYQREVTDGIVNLTSLPVDSDMVVTINPSDTNWTSRTAYIQSIYQQQSVYLLNVSNVDSAVENRFILDDPTGEFGPQTTLFIQRPIEINGSTIYQTIHADEFGVEGVTATLEEGIRYRIKIQSEDGVSQIVGPYRAELAETVTIEPGTPGIQIETFTDGLGYAASIDNTTVAWKYADPGQETDQLTVWIHEKNNPDNQLVPNESYFDIGNASNEFEISSNESEKAWVVNFVVQKGSNTTIYHDTIQNQKDLFASLAPGWQAAIGVSLLVLFAGAFSILNAAIGAVIVSLAGGLLWWVGLLSGVTTAMSVAIALFISVAYYLASSGRP